MNYIQKRLYSFKYAFKGLGSFFKNETHARIHGLVGVVVMGLALYLDVSKTEWLVLLLTIALVISAEVVNSSIERLTDIASPEISEKAGLVKDMAAGAVLVTALFSLVIGGLIFVPKIFEII